MSTLLIRCPLKPFAGAFTGLAGEWEDLACAQRFEWCLVEDADALFIINNINIGIHANDAIRHRQY
jgi:hypothetical protein